MTTLEELGGWPVILRALVARDDLTSTQARAALASILDGRATDAQIAGFIVGLRQKGETIEELGGFLDAMLDVAERVILPEGLVAVDTCGTGGSPSRSQACFNVSTLAGLVIAGAGGVVCKHGGRAASATSSSGDLLEALGVAVELGPAGVAACVVDVGFGFCFAPRYHPAMRFAGPVRKQLGVPTTFNFLGPLANPARVERQVLGVSDPQMATKMIGVLQARGAERALVVYGHDGLDELTTTTTSTVLELRSGAIRTYSVDPDDLGIPRADSAALLGGDPTRNAALARSVLAGEPGAHRDIVVLNAAAGLVAGGVVDDLEAGVEASRASIDSGAAATVLEKVVVVSQAERAREI